MAREPGSGTRRYLEEALHAQAGLDRSLTRRLLAVWPAGRQLTGAAADLRAIVVRPG